MILPEFGLTLCRRRIKQQILHRDSWRCQSCGTMSNLEVDHKLFCSQSGQDSEENLITRCARCHRHVHSPRVDG
jgi:5-methylcytosine-specific restriction endonuclease McrA